MNKFILHCGFPKCASTSLQNLFSSEKNNYLGFFPNSNKNDNFYSVIEIGEFFEQTVRFGDTKSFDLAHNKIRKKLEVEINSSKKTTILSNENLLGRFIPYDLPNDIKIERLCKTLPKETEIIISTRNPEDILYSYFNMYMANGYSGNIEYFIKEILILNKNFGMIESMRIKPIIEKFNKLRDDIKITILSLEEIKEAHKSLNRLNVIGKLEQHNSSIRYKDLSYHISINKSFFQGKKFLDWFEIHRTFPSAKIQDSEKYKLSRSRHLHEAIVQKLNLPESSNNKKIFMDKVKETVKKVADENKIFLKNYKV